MWQAVIAYLIVAAAAAWVAWTLFLPTPWRAALRGRVRQALGRAGSERATDGCACERKKA
jgi:hypothetical protein